MRKIDTLTLSLGKRVNAAYLGGDVQGEVQGVKEAITGNAPRGNGGRGKTTSSSGGGASGALQPGKRGPKVLLNFSEFARRINILTRLINIDRLSSREC